MYVRIKNWTQTALKNLFAHSPPLQQPEGETRLCDLNRRFLTTRFLLRAGAGVQNRVKDHTDFFEGPWEIVIDGLIENPMTLDVKELIAMFHLEERLYRHRCVEAWSITVPGPRQSLLRAYFSCVTNSQLALCFVCTCPKSPMEKERGMTIDVHTHVAGRRSRFVCCVSWTIGW